MASAFITNDMITFIKTTVQFLEQVADDYKAVIPEAIGFERQCRHIEDMISPILREDPEFNDYLLKYAKNGFSDRTHHTGDKAITKDIIKSLYMAQKRLNDFISQEQQMNKSIFMKIKWFAKKTYTARDQRGYFKSENERIRSLLNDLVQTRSIAAGSGIVTIDRFEKDMPKECFRFWMRYIGKDIVTDWHKFHSAYTLLYGDIEPEESDYIQKILCKKSGTTITVYGLIGISRKHNFPFENIGKDIPPVEKVLSEEARMEIAKMVMGLVSEFAEPTMSGHLTCMYKWYEGVGRDKAAIQERANEWAVLNKQFRKAKEPTEKQKEAKRLDEARRAISFFYQRYMVMWRIGHLSREAFVGVDFPGKGRMRDFIRYVQPLDHANYHIVMGKDTSTWDQKKPLVYQFLEQFLVDNSDKPAKAQIASPPKAQLKQEVPEQKQEEKKLGKKELPQLVQAPAKVHVPEKIEVPETVPVQAVAAH
ncbi:hypothetical protein BJV82DRAFT_629743 [Fennellomyces sp. T-0311]|nr:hypothetical protein BJV82DRAFT_629743 [Fennellomyces sp. T-0311]